jgi:hypothetical protein
VSALHHDATLKRPDRRTVAITLALLGGTLGLIAGLLELTIGPSIRSWVGNKADTTRLGLATLLLAAIALGSTWALEHGSAGSAGRRALVATGVLLPGLICFTTVGRLWYVPGALLVAAGMLLTADLWSERHEIGTAMERNWTAILTASLALFYVFLGATARGVAGMLGIIGGLGILALIATRGAVSRPGALVLLLCAALPFAVLTWWSVATLVIALLLLAVGTPALTGQRGRPNQRALRLRTDRRPELHVRRSETNKEGTWEP